MSLEEEVSRIHEANRHAAAATPPPPPTPDAELLAFAGELRDSLRKRGVAPQPIYQIVYIHRGIYKNPRSLFDKLWEPPRTFVQNRTFGSAWKFRESNPPVWDGVAFNEMYCLREDPLTLFTYPTGPTDPNPEDGFNPGSSVIAVESEPRWALTRMRKSLRDGAINYLLALDRGESNWEGPSSS